MFQHIKLLIDDQTFACVYDRPEVCNKHFHKYRRQFDLLISVRNKLKRSKTIVCQRQYLSGRNRSGAIFVNIGFVMSWQYPPASNAPASDPYSFGQPSQPPAQSGYPPQPAWGAPPANPYGQPGGFGQPAYPPAQPGGYPPQPAWGAPPAGFGQPGPYPGQAPGYQAAPPAAWGAPPPGFGQPGAYPGQAPEPSYAPAPCSAALPNTANIGDGEFPHQLAPQHYAPAPPQAQVPPEIMALYQVPPGEPPLPPPVVTGTRKAVVIGINYLSHQQGQLRGCIPDANNMEAFLISRGFQQQNIRKLTDDNHNAMPTRANMLAAMQWLVQGAQPGDSLVSICFC